MSSEIPSRTHFLCVLSKVKKGKIIVLPLILWNPVLCFLKDTLRRRSRSGFICIPKSVSIYDFSPSALLLTLLH